MKAGTKKEKAEKKRITVEELPPDEATRDLSAEERKEVKGGLAVDPSDPSGNTVYVSGASGGVWKTTNFNPDSKESRHS